MKISKFMAVVGMASLMSSANAALVVTWGNSFPLGPFSPTQIVQIRATAINTSTVDSITLCEGICLGDAKTYSLGASASHPTDYSFHWGTGQGFLNGQLNGQLLPGQAKDFIFGEFTPDGEAAVGWYNLGAGIQVFEATVARPMIYASSINEYFQVQVSPVPLPAAAWLMLAGLGALGAAAKRRKTPAVQA